ncbi:acyltransferase family protein [Staphylococcus massiliensis]|uniref:Acyltransferase 3 domain-containing protein n=1 Tax=Staphylococcus massiliensis S46 TaxID=1229783 RepID=K9AZ27_9STAP|nr:acyltransferase family protein [Staphylococcus massiliensis]EKU47792.1 hypothetical protein C273_07107 [Staphylococcus massiliensis S46]PNZ98265.1 acyltransferase [Staphylococcus massiliensis CCUG 55927]
MTQNHKRDYYFDNARAWLIFLVVFGHVVRPHLESDKILTTLYLFIYSFHMPTFLFISGYFAKKAGQEGYLEKVGKKLLAPYVIFFSFFSIYYYFTGKNAKIELDPFDPIFALWFLLTLFFFNVILIVVKQFKPIYVLVGSIILSVFAGFSTDINGFLSVSRTVVFFPIFYVGYLMSKSQTTHLQSKKWLPASIGVLAILFIAYWIHPINSSWLLGSSPYKDVSVVNAIWSPLKRLVLYGIIFSSMFAFLNLMSKNKKWYTYIGTRTLYVYLLHGIFVGVLRGFEIKPFTDNLLIETLYIIAISTFIVWLLSTDFIAKWTNPIINLKSPSNFKPKS